MFNPHKCKCRKFIELSDIAKDVDIAKKSRPLKVNTKLCSADKVNYQSRRMYMHSFLFNVL